jgi:transposase
VRPGRIRVRHLGRRSRPSSPAFAAFWLAPPLLARPSRRLRRFRFSPTASDSKRKQPLCYSLFGFSHLAASSFSPLINGLMYILATGCQWRAIPKDLPPKSTIYDYFDLWTYDGTLEDIHHALYVKCR